MAAEAHGILLTTTLAGGSRNDVRQLSPLIQSAGALSGERREQLEEIDASWCPSWPVTWQRSFHLVRMHLDAGEALPTEAGEVMGQGEDLGRWVTSVRYAGRQMGYELQGRQTVLRA
ncbi:hypothetical protein ACFWFI_35755 [Streptomyces sp. NPDC060209]|uniref:hypothetical protein n=1 Tax=Streptomyces sp. NPDC060209 TaxID=3347073 RepID=UPI0036586722